MWLCASTSPGITKRSLQSSTSAPAWTGVDAAGPTAVIWPPSTTITAWRTGGAPVASKSVPQRMARSATGDALDPGRRAGAVVPPRGLAAHVALADVPAHRLRIALGGRPVAPAPAGHDAHPLPRRDRMLGRLAHLPDRPVGRGDLDPVDRAVLAAVQAPGRRHLALEAEGDERGGEELVEPLDAEPTAEATGPARVRTQAVTQDADGRRAGLHHLDRVVPRGRPREDDHGRLAVVGRPPAGAPRVQVALDEEPPGLRMGAEGDRGHLVAVGAGRDAIRHRLRERAQAQVDQKVDRHVVARGRRRLLAVQHRALRDNHP